MVPDPVLDSGDVRPCWTRVEWDSRQVDVLVVVGINDPLVTRQHHGPANVSSFAEYRLGLDEIDYAFVIGVRTKCDLRCGAKTLGYVVFGVSVMMRLWPACDATWTTCSSPEKKEKLTLRKESKKPCSEACS